MGTREEVEEESGVNREVAREMVQVNFVVYIQRRWQVYIPMAGLAREVEREKGVTRGDG